MQNIAKQTLTQYKKRVEREIVKYFETEIPKARKVSSFSGQVIKKLGGFTLRGGKRLRAAFVYYAYLLLNGRNKREIVKTSVFIELIHSYLLIEDDIMDESDTRRGKATMHKIYRDYHLRNFKKRDPQHFGESIAINVGLISSHLGLNILNNSKFPVEYKEKAIKKLNEQLAQTGYGQIHDVLLEVQKQVKEADVLRVHLLKTARYTYETPLHIGAILAGAKDKDLKILSGYAIPAGIAFQIQDDILGLFGDEERLGKPVDSDLKEGKQTLLILKALKNGSRKDRKTINEALGNPKLTKRQLKEVRKIVVDTGSYDYSKKLAEKYVREAQKVVPKMEGWNSKGRKFLEGIAQYMIEREL